MSENPYESPEAQCQEPAATRLTRAEFKRRYWAWTLFFYIIPLIPTVILFYVLWQIIAEGTFTDGSKWIVSWAPWFALGLSTVSALGLAALKIRENKCLESVESEAE